MKHKKVLLFYFEEKMEEGGHLFTVLHQLFFYLLMYKKYLYLYLKSLSQESR